VELLPLWLTFADPLRFVHVVLRLQGMDVLFLHHTIAATLDQKGHSVQLLFAFEYIILASTAAATLLKYLLSMLDAAMEGRWEGKGTYVFYLELLKDMMHLFVYCIFFVIVFSNYGLPLHLVSWGGWGPALGAATMVRAVC
jgi:E3 ubiquitin-protein ligase synoviolin